MKPFLTCSSPPHPLHRSAIRSSHRQSHCRPIWAIYAVLKPSLVRQVARVAQSRTVVDLPLLHGPHRASPPCPTSTAKPLPRFVNLPDRFSGNWIGLNKGSPPQGAGYSEKRR